MHILILTSRFPYPIEKGDKLRIYHQIRALSQHHTLSLISLTEQKVSGEAVKALQPFCQRIQTFQLRSSGLMGQLLPPIGSLPFQVAYFFRPRIHRAIQELIHQWQPDHLYCQLIRMAPYAREVPLPKTLDYMDAFSWGMHRRSQHQVRPLRPLFAWEAARLRAYERAVYADFQYHSIISQQDARHLHLPEDSRVAVVPNGVDLSYFSPRAPVSVPRDMDLVFVGNMGYAPNVLAAKYLVQRVLPKLRKTHPGIRLLLAGARPAPSVKALARVPSVSVSGWLPDIREGYAQGKVFIAPLFTGSGQQNKILEAMAMGLPCITTPSVNEAIGAQEGLELLLAEHPEGFVQHANFLLASENERLKMGQRARRFMEGHYSWEQATRPLLDLWT